MSRQWLIYCFLFFFFTPFCFLISSDGHEVGVIYFRSGYEPAQYHGQKEWDARLMMERSTAIKCPSIHYHLAGTKKARFKCLQFVFKFFA